MTRDDRRHRKLTLSGRKAARRQGFSARRQTKIIIHGFLDHGDVEWIKVGSKMDQILRQALATLHFDLDELELTK